MPGGAGDGGGAAGGASAGDAGPGTEGCAPSEDEWTAVSDTHANVESENNAERHGNPIGGEPSARYCPVPPPGWHGW